MAVWKLHYSGLADFAIETPISSGKLPATFETGGYTIVVGSFIPP